MIHLLSPAPPASPPPHFGHVLLHPLLARCGTPFLGLSWKCSAMSEPAFRHNRPPLPQEYWLASRAATSRTGYAYGDV